MCQSPVILQQDLPCWKEQIQLLLSMQIARIAMCTDLTVWQLLKVCSSLVERLSPGVNGLQEHRVTTPQ